MSKVSESVSDLVSMVEAGAGADSDAGYSVGSIGARTDAGGTGG
jgi:hypothetical protein